MGTQNPRHRPTPAWLPAAFSRRSWWAVVLAGWWACLALALAPEQG